MFPVPTLTLRLRIADNDSEFDLVAKATDLMVGPQLKCRPAGDLHEGSNVLVAAPVRAGLANLVRAVVVSVQWPEATENEHERSLMASRASGDVVCRECGRQYIMHSHDVRFRPLFLLCDGSLVKL